MPSITTPRLGSLKAAVAIGLSALLALAAASGAALTQATPHPSAGTPLSVEDIAGLTTLSNVILSPDGKWVAWVATAVDWDKNLYNPDLWLAKASGDPAPRRITFSEEAESSPAFSPDGKSLFFLSGRSGSSQIWRLSLAGGEAQQITEAPTAVSEFAVAPSGDSLLFIRGDEPPASWTERVKTGDDARVLGAWYPYGHLYRQQLGGEHGFVKHQPQKNEPEQLTHGTFHHSAIAISRDGTQIALSRQPTPRVPDGFRTDVVLLSTGLEPRVLVDWEGTDTAPLFSPDGTQLAFLSADRVLDWAGETHLSVLPLAGGSPKVVSRAHNRSVRFYEWSPDGKTLYFHGPKDLRAQLFALDVASGQVRDLSQSEGVISSGDFSPAHDLVAFAWESLDAPPEIYVSRLESFEPRRLSSHNRHLEDRELGETRVLRWKNPKDGLEIEGLLTLPIGYEVGAGPVPLLTFAHGGPASFFDEGFLGYLYYVYPTHVFAERGYAVLRPNPRGSGSYGEPFKRANRSDWGGMDYQDIQTGIDLLIEQGIADPERLGLMGWSYGGFMTSWSITQTDRFKAASIGAPVTDLFSFQGSADIPDFIPSYFEGLPYTNQERYRAHNPMSHVQNVKTPSLIQHGEADLRVPLFQGQIYYQALLDLGVPSEMVVYPRTPHVPLEPRLRVDTMLRNLWWFDKWIAGDERSFQEYAEAFERTRR